MPVLFCFGVSMQTQVVRTLAWDFHPCPFLWTNNPAGYSAVAGSIIITVSSALVPLSPYAFRVPADCRQVAAYLLFSRGKLVVTDNEIFRQINSRNFVARL